jgi:hypothetical protein
VPLLTAVSTTMSSDEKVPRFLQQTTSQLLHQQEALRKRREMLERESNKPPAMRFGTSNPPRSHSRHGKSPVPTPTQASISSHTATPPRGDNVHRELNWSRADDEPLAERAPMRFSMTFRAAPTPVAANRPRTATGTHSVPPSPCPREVNTADQLSAVSRKVSRDASSPRKVSPRSPPPQRARAEENGVAAENMHHDHHSSSSRSPATASSMWHNAHVPVQVLVPRQRSTSKAAVCQERSDEEVEEELTRAEKRQSLPPPPLFTLPQGTTTSGVTCGGGGAEETATSSDATGITGFSHTFPVPRYTSSTPLATVSENRTRFNEREGEEQKEAEEEAQSTPGRPAVGEFRTPRPVTRMSTSLTPMVRTTTVQTSSSNVTNADDSRNASAVGGPHSDAHAATERSKHDSGDEEGKEANTTAVSPTVDDARDAASPVPTPSQIFTSVQTSADKRRGPSATPAMSRDHAEVCSEERHDPTPTSRMANFSSASRSLELRTPSPTRRTKVSPAPTAQDLIQSVQVSADRRPCGCERPTPSPERWHNSRQRITTTASPPPTPVPLSDTPMTEFDSALHMCCDRPTPASLSSQPAGGEARARAAPSASPWPTTEHIITSILAGTQEEQRRAREREDEDEDDRKEGTTNRFSNEEEERNLELRSPTAAAPHHPTQVKEEALVAKWASARTPSPVPTERQYGQSVLASAEKRRCGRPTPSERQVSSLSHHSRTDGSDGAEARQVSRLAGLAAGTSASPQPSTHHLLDSLDVSISKVNARERPAERDTEDDEGDEMPEGESNEASAEHHHHGSSGPREALRTPSPTPTPEHVIASLQASAEKRTRSAALTVLKTSDEATQQDSGSFTSGSPYSSSFHSPTLTPQNVKDSIQKLVRDMHQQTRSDAQAPRRPWGEGNSTVGEATLNSSASPAVTAEGVDVSLATLEHDQRCKSRSVRGEREADQPPPSRDTSGGGAAVERDAPTSPHTVVSSTLPLLPMAASPTASDVVMQSAVFFDCFSGPVTPSAPTVETVGLERTTTVATTTMVSAAASVDATGSVARVPAQFFELQREVAEISQGRSRTRTPPPICAGESSSSVPPQTPPKELSNADDDAPMPVNEAEKGRRSSLLLVQPTYAHQALIQHPHEPVPVMPPATISPVQVPRTPTPPPRHLQGTAGKRDSHPRRQDIPLQRGGGESGESPLPRPVSLRSQVLLLRKQPLSQPQVHHSHSPAPAWGTAVSAQRSTESIAGSCAHYERDVEPRPRVRLSPQPAVPHRSHHRNGGKDEEEDNDLFDPKNDWMDLVEPLRPHTITVSPQNGAVVYMTHSTGNAENTVGSDEDEQAEQQHQPLPLSSSPALRKRSRSARTPPARPTTTQRTTAAVMTPASVALTMDDGISSGGKSSDLLMHTPSSHVSQTPHSSTRGRRSQAEELLAMLPADVAAEVARIGEPADVVDDDDAEVSASNRRLSTGSPASRLSGLSEDDSVTAQTSTISQRVSQRVRRVRHTDDYYIQYLEGIARSSAKKTRAAAGRRMQKTINKDLKEEKRKKEGGGEGCATLSASKATRTTAVSPRRSQATASSTATPSSLSSDGLADVLLSPMSPSLNESTPAGLKVSTQLSAELQQALFQPATTTNKEQSSPQKGSDGSTTASVKPKKAKKAKRASVPSPKRCSLATTKPSSSPAPTPRAKAAKKARTHRGGKVARKFVTAKSLRTVKHHPHSSKKR